jgi:hypothetical protein
MAIFTIANCYRWIDVRSDAGWPKVLLKSSPISPISSDDCARSPKKRAFFAVILSLAGNFTELIKKEGLVELEH